MTTIRCKNDLPYIELPLVQGEFRWHIYNKNSGHIVASTYCETMALCLLEGIKYRNLFYSDEYAITETY